jgi:hypothetical protein
VASTCPMPRRKSLPSSASRPTRTPSARLARGRCGLCAVVAALRADAHDGGPHCRRSADAVPKRALVRRVDSIWCWTGPGLPRLCSPARTCCSIPCRT